MCFSNRRALISARSIFGVWFVLGLALCLMTPVHAQAAETEIVAEKILLTITALTDKQLNYLNRLNQKQLDQVVSVAVVGDQGQLLGQVWGSVSLSNNTLVFTPRFPFDDNQQYFARFQLGSDTFSDVISKRFAFVDQQQPEAEVVQVYPSANTLPENLFKFYIHFSHPMRRGEAYQHITLLDQNQRPVELPFLELTQELWDPDGKRFTLLFDPGRTKQGIKPNRDMGLPLQQGKQFTLVIDSAWRDVKGLPLRQEFRKNFLVGPQDHQQPDMNRWALTLPNSGSRNPVIVKFDEPMDRAQSENAIWIETDNGKVITGEVTIEDELIWRFTPTLGWRTGNYRLVARSYLEDRAANSLGRLFEVIRTEKDPEIPDTYSLEFSLDPSS